MPKACHSPRLVNDIPQNSHCIIIAQVLKVDIIHLQEEIKSNRFQQSHESIPNHFSQTLHSALSTIGGHV